MNTVMIVDDEYIIRKGLKNFIDWKSIDCKVIAEASDGLSAKKMIVNHNPDIIISDIKMPGIDGIELSKYVYDNHPLTKIILLTGYSDFNYAQSAVKYNVVDFVLKPSSNEKIIAAVNKAKELISKYEYNRITINNLEKEINLKDKLVLEKYLLDLLNNTYIENQYYKDALLKLNLINYYVIVLELYNYEDKIDGFELRETLFKIKDFVSGLFKERESYTVTINHKTIGIIVSFESSDDELNKNSISKECTEIISFVARYVRLPIQAGVSDIYNDINKIQECYSEALHTLEYKYYDIKNIYYYSDIKNSVINNPEEQLQIHAIISALELGDIETTEENLKILCYSQKHNRMPLTHIQSVAVQLLTESYIILEKLHISPKYEKHVCYENLLDTTNIKQLYNKLKDILLNTVHQVDCSKKQENFIIEKALNYIDSNYHKSISLDMISNHVHLNSCYLSRLFKKETGHTLTESITQKRIEVAMELLDNLDMRTYEVASKVGYLDPAYFSQVFKKCTGMSPKSYRQSKQT